MLLEDIAEGSNALVEAAIDLSRLFGAKVCCLDRSASVCGTPVAQAIRPEGDSGVDTGRCAICLDRDAEACDPVLRTAVFIVSRSAPTLERAISRGFGPVLLIPDPQEACRLAGRALVVVDGAPMSAGNLRSVLPVLRVATAVEIVTLCGAAPSDAQEMLAALDRGGLTSPTDVHLSIGALEGTDIHAECDRFRADWCLVTAQPVRGDTGIGVTASRLLANPPCPVIVMP